MRKFLGIILLSILFCISMFAYEQSKTLNLPVKGINVFEMECGAGYLKIQGIEGLEEIQVTANIIIEGISKKRIPTFIEDKVILHLKKEGNRARLVSKIKNPKRSWFSLKKRRFVINLDIKTPASLKMNVNDGSGEITIRDLGSDVILDDGSCSIIIENVKGSVQINDGSGSMKIADIGGDTSIVDGSGEIFTKSLHGNLKIKDGSGSIDVKNISKSVKIKDGSGSMDIFQVSGSVWISDGSGSIYLNTINGDVTIAEAGSGGLKIKNVQGRVTKE